MKTKRLFIVSGLILGLGVVVTACATGDEELTASESSSAALLAQLEDETLLPFSATDNCVTGQTGINFVKKTCNGTVCFQAPQGYYISMPSVRVETVDERGTGSGCGDPYEAESVPFGAFSRKTTKVCVGFNARSYSGISSGTGRVECRLVGIQGR